MATIVIFYSAPGVRPGVHEEAGLLRWRHAVRAVDRYDRRIVNDYGSAMASVREIGFPALMAKALELTNDLPAGFVSAGFSNGGGMGGYVAASSTGRRGSPGSSPVASISESHRVITDRRARVSTDPGDVTCVVVLGRHQSRGHKRTHQRWHALPSSRQSEAASQTAGKASSGCSLAA
jgi:hypothetical protein